MTPDDELDQLIHRVDIDGLVRLVDNRASSADWAGVRTARDRARSAIATGRQVWPIATLAEYRLALLAPPDWAAPMISDDAGLFTIGPLTEVVAQHHTWAELAPLLDPTPGASLVAHERALRGEPIDQASVADLPDVLDLAYEIATWEPAYPLATYSDAGVDAPSPPIPSLPPDRHERGAAAPRRDHGVELAVRQLLEAWTASSNGHAEVACVDGDVDDAVGALGVPSWRRADIGLAEGLSWLSWAGASGGAHGRRRGAAVGRFGALWSLASLLDLTDDWPVPLDELGAMAGSLQWFWWDAGEPSSGWRVQLAVADSHRGVAWAISARDDA